VPELRRLVADFPPRRPGLDPRACGICGGQSSTGAGFLRVLRFPPPVLIPESLSVSSGAGTIGQIVADVLSGLSLTPPQETSPLIGLLYQPQMTDDECGAVAGMRIGRGNRSTRRKPAPVSHSSQQIPHDVVSNPGRRGVKPATKLLQVWYGPLYN
jgi:hypothetical protein